MQGQHGPTSTWIEGASRSASLESRPTICTISWSLVTPMALRTATMDTCRGMPATQPGNVRGPQKGGRQERIAADKEEREEDMLTSSVKVLWRRRKRPFLMTMFVLLFLSWVLLVTDPVTLHDEASKRGRP